MRRDRCIYPLWRPPPSTLLATTGEPPFNYRGVISTVATCRRMDDQRYRRITTGGFCGAQRQRAMVGTQRWHDIISCYVYAGAFPTALFAYLTALRLSLGASLQPLPPATDPARPPPHSPTTTFARLCAAKYRCAPRASIHRVRDST